MAFTKALYYPTIEVQDEAWLRSASLYWDNIQTIVPESIQKPYSSHISKILNDEGILMPFIIKSNSSLVRDLADSAIKFVQTNEAQQLFLTKKSPSYRVHQDKLPKEFRIHKDKLPEEFRMHSDKLSYFMRHEFAQKIDSNGWFKASYEFAEFYMSLLANKICEDKRLALLSDNSYASDLAERARLDVDFKKTRSYSVSPRHDESIINFAEGLLTNLVIQGVRLRSDTSIKKILKFKSDHKDELGLFRTNIGRLVKDVPVKLSSEALQQYINDIYINEFLPGLNNLTKALDGSGIKWNFENLMRISVMSAAGTTVLPTLGMSTSIALFASIGISLIGNKIIYNVERKKVIRENPYSYLMLAESKLNANNFADFIKKTII